MNVVAGTAAPADEQFGAEPAFRASTPWYRRTEVQILGGAFACLVVLNIVLSGTETFPDSWYADVRGHVNDVQSWIQRNRNTNWFIADVLRPIGDFVLWLYDTLVDWLVDLPWYWLPLMLGLIILRSGHWLMAVCGAGSLLYLEVAGLHEVGMQTIALMVICVLVCIAVGGPLGIWAGLNPRVERIMRPVLDAMQTLPVTLYLVVAIMPFGIRQTPAAIATIAFGVPPMIRISALGIRQVPTASVEAGRIFGSSGFQLLRKVQMPQAAKSFVTAINQTIMMCLGVAVIGALIGAGGLGGDLIQTLKLRSPGRGFIVGFGIFAIAFAFDRLSRSLIERRKPNWFSRVRANRYWPAVGVVALAGLIFGGSAKVPWTFEKDIASPIDDALDWVQRNHGDTLANFSDKVVTNVVRIQDLLGTSIAWPVLIIGVAVLGLVVRSWAFAVFCAIGLLGIGMLGMWTWSITTLSQIIVAVAIGMVIALPIGIFIGRRGRLEAAVEPILDALQTLPSFIYAIPFVMLFRVGYVPAILATMLYAIPAGIRLSALAMKTVSSETLEAATTFGATNRQRLWGVHIPLARRGLVLAVNQLIMMSISMAIIAGQVGENGLGYKSVEALTKPDVGVGIEAGLSLLVMAIILDRMMEGLADKFDTAPAAGH